MTKNKSFYIRNKNLSHNDKLNLRQNLVCDLTEKNCDHFNELFKIGFSIDMASEKNCENLIGSIEVPLGIVGPVFSEINYISKSGKVSSKGIRSYLVPLATTEGALIASVHRGIKLINNGKTTVNIKKIGMSRSVVFECNSITDAVLFDQYFKKNIKIFANFCEQTSSHLKFLEYESYLRDKLLYFRFVFDTDQAMGMNMVTIALSYAWDKFKRQLPNDIRVSLLTISGNVCTDKKDSIIKRIKGRGYYVTVETKVSLEDAKKILKVDPKKLVKTHIVKNVIGSNVAGSFAQNMHVANVLGAFYLATGQDIAHVVAGSEASVHFEVIDDQELYVALTLPNVTVGSIGGGTWFPKQKQARSLINKKMPKANDLAICVGLVSLAGEISGLAALSTDTLASAHQKLGR